uniref:Uncharacterized protein n=1 Tax=Avena sativa TaxID=4498 RepID=A0ACD6A265_AVESA
MLLTMAPSGYFCDFCPPATSFTSTGESIQVSFHAARPPQVSHFCVFCPDLGPAGFVVPPKVVSADSDLVLFRVSVCPQLRFTPRACDYFLYRAHPRSPSLHLLPHPYPSRFSDREAALLSLGNEYAVAALRRRYPKNNENVALTKEFNLYLYRSMWRLAWSAGSTSGAASSSAMCSRRIPSLSTYHCRCRRGGTGDSTTDAAPTSSGTSLSACLKIPSSTSRWKTHPERLLPRMRSADDDKPSESEETLPAHLVAFPTISMDDDVVYLLYKAYCTGQTDVVIAVDMRKKILQGFAELVAGKDFTFTRNCASEISKYLC